MATTVKPTSETGLASPLELPQQGATQDGASPSLKQPARDQPARDNEPQPAPVQEQSVEPNEPEEPVPAQQDSEGRAAPRLSIDPSAASQGHDIEHPEPRPRTYSHRAKRFGKDRRASVPVQHPFSVSPLAAQMAGLTLGGYPQYWYPYLQSEQYAYSPKGVEPAPSSPMAYPQPVMYGGYYASMGPFPPQSPQWAPYSPDQFAQYAYPGPSMPFQAQPSEELPQPTSEAVATPASEGSREPYQESTREEGRDRSRRGSLAKGQHKAGAGPSPWTYKTEICANHMATGTCNYGASCQFAHGIQELRPRPFDPKYKTELCSNYHSDGVCMFGSRCKFIHDEYRMKGEDNESWLISPSENIVRVECVSERPRGKDSSRRSSVSQATNEPSAAPSKSSPSPSGGATSENEEPGLLPQPTSSKPASSEGAQPAQESAWNQGPSQSSRHSEKSKSRGGGRGMGRRRSNSDASQYRPKDAKDKRPEDEEASPSRARRYSQGDASKPATPSSSYRRSSHSRQQRSRSIVSMPLTPSAAFPMSVPVPMPMSPLAMPISLAPQPVPMPVHFAPQLLPEAQMAPLSLMPHSEPPMIYDSMPASDIASPAGPILISLSGAWPPGVQPPVPTMYPQQPPFAAASVSSPTYIPRSDPSLPSPPNSTYQATVPT